MPRRDAAAVAVLAPGDPERVLLVRRPADDPDLPGLWGLPAVTLRPGETPEAAAERVGPDKLGAPLRLRGRLAAGAEERASYRLRMTLFEAELAGGAPDLGAAQAGGGTRYTDWRWDRPQALEASARQGSLCCRLLLEALAGRPPARAASQAPPRRDTVIVKFHELALKGRNRRWFVQRLIENLRQATSDLPVERVWAGQMMVGLTLRDEGAWEQVRERVRRTFGVAKCFPAYKLPPDLEAVERLLDEVVPTLRFESFRITANRADKAFPLKSEGINRRLGARVQARTGARVDLAHPALEIFVDVLRREFLVYFQEVPGYGGLPVGTGGRVLALLSSGIDSPVAAWHMMKRGCEVEFVHFHSHPLVDTTTMEKAEELVRVLTAYQYRSRLHHAPLARVQRRIILSIPPPFRVVFYRRFMVRIAEALARRAGARALVTGESLGQVSSQTLENIAVVDELVGMPVLRPLIGLNKQEIMDLARRIGTYPISIQPDQDCCTLFVPRRVVTRARPEEVHELEGRLEVEALVAEALEGVETVEFAFPPTAERAAHLEPGAVPLGERVRRP